MRIMGRKSSNLAEVDAYAEPAVLLKQWAPPIQALIAAIKGNMDAWKNVYASCYRIETAASQIYAQDDIQAQACIKAFGDGHKAINPGPPEGSPVILASRNVSESVEQLTTILTKIKRAEEMQIKLAQLVKKYRQRESQLTLLIAKEAKNKTTPAKVSRAEMAIRETADSLNGLADQLFDNLEEIDSQRLNVTDCAVRALIQVQHLHYDANPSRQAKAKSIAYKIGTRSVPRQTNQDMKQRQPPHVSKAPHKQPHSPQPPISAASSSQSTSPSHQSRSHPVITAAHSFDQLQIQYSQHSNPPLAHSHSTRAALPSTTNPSNSHGSTTALHNPLNPEPFTPPSRTSEAPILVPGALSSKDAANPPYCPSVSPKHSQTAVSTPSASGDCHMNAQPSNQIPPSDRHLYSHQNPAQLFQQSPNQPPMQPLPQPPLQPLAQPPPQPPTQPTPPLLVQPPLQLQAQPPVHTPVEPSWKPPPQPPQTLSQPPSQQQPQHPPDPPPRKSSLQLLSEQPLQEHALSPLTPPQQLPGQLLVQPKDQPASQPSLHSPQQPFGGEQREEPKRQLRAQKASPGEQQDQQHPATWTDGQPQQQPVGQLPQQSTEVQQQPSLQQVQQQTQPQSQQQVQHQQEYQQQPQPSAHNSAYLPPQVVAQPPMPSARQSPIPGQAQPSVQAAIQPGVQPAGSSSGANFGQFQQPAMQQPLQIVPQPYQYQHQQQLPPQPVAQPQPQPQLQRRATYGAPGPYMVQTGVQQEQAHWGKGAVANVPSQMYAPKPAPQQQPLLARAASHSEPQMYQPTPPQRRQVMQGQPTYVQEGQQAALTHRYSYPASPGHSQGLYVPQGPVYNGQQQMPPQAGHVQAGQEGMGFSGPPTPWIQPTAPVATPYAGPSPATDGKLGQDTMAHNMQLPANMHQAGYSKPSQ